MYARTYSVIYKTWSWKWTRDRIKMQIFLAVAWKWERMYWFPPPKESAHQTQHLFNKKSSSQSSLKFQIIRSDSNGDGTFTDQNHQQGTKMIILEFHVCSTKNPWHLKAV